MKIGIDIEKISRFSKLKFEKNERFYKKIFTPLEIKYCIKKSNPYQHFTARYCVKEATMKALEDNNLEFKKIEIKMKKAKPILSLSEDIDGIISMSHTDEYAIAVVILF